MNFSDIPVRSNGDDVIASWWNVLRTAGLAAAQGKRFTKTHTDMQAAALTNDIEIYSLSANEIFLGSLIKPTTAFAGSGITGYTLSLGIAGNLTKYTSTFDATAAVADSNHLFTWNPKIESFASDGNSATSIRLSAVATGANLDQSSAGAVEIYLLTAGLPTS